MLNMASALEQAADRYPEADAVITRLSGSLQGLEPPGVRRGLHAAAAWS